MSRRIVATHYPGEEIFLARKVCCRMTCPKAWTITMAVQSGIGVEFGEEGLAEYTDIQTVLM